MCAVCFTASQGLVVAGIAARAWYVNRFGGADDPEAPGAGVASPAAQHEPPGEIAGQRESGGSDQGVA
jgi:hypothetical protein